MDGEGPQAEEIRGSGHLPSQTQHGPACGGRTDGGSDRHTPPQSAHHLAYSVADCLESSQAVTQAFKVLMVVTVHILVVA